MPKAIVRMPFTESVPTRCATARLDSSKPFDARNPVDSTIAAQGDRGSTSTCTLHGPMACLNRFMAIFHDRDQTVGEALAGRFAKLRALAERP